MSTADAAPFQLFPMLDGATEAALRASIERFGVLVPVMVDQHGRILDGHHRARIADELGVRYEPVVHRVLDDEHAAAIALEVNMHRRHLDGDQRRAVVIALAADGHSQVAIADALKVSRKTVQNDLQGATGSTLPDYVTARDGKSYPRTIRPMTAKEARTVDRQETLAAQRLDYDADPTYATDAVRRGDFRDVLADIEPGTVDLILTDPPYGSTAVGLYADLAEHAARWLRPGGSLIAYAGHSTLPDVLDVMRPHLRYQWTCCLYQGSPTVALPAVGIFVGWKPVLWMMRGPRTRLRMMNDVIRGGGVPDQSEHRWAQSVEPIVSIIETLTDPGDLIVDPFAGTGRWGERALSMNRRWIGADIGGAVIP